MSEGALADVVEPALVPRRAGGARDVEGGARLRIVHVLAPASFGGLEQVVHSLSLAQRRAGHTVHVVSVVEPGCSQPAFVDALADTGIHVHPLELGAREYLRERRTVNDIITRVNADVVHTHGYRADLVHGIGRPAAAARVTTLHGFCGVDWKGRMYERLQRRVVRRFDGVVAVSRLMADQLRAAGVGAARLHCVPNAYVATTAFLPRVEARAQLGVRADGFVVGFIGRLGLEKGPDLFLDAIARAGVGATAILIGDGRMRDELARHPVTRSGDVRFLGMVPNAARLIRAFDALVLSSRTEGTPMVLLEAMAAEVPVVATRVGGIPDVIGSDEGLLVEPADASALAQAIASIRSDEEAAAARAAHARARLDQHYGPEAWLESYENVYGASIRLASASRRKL